MCVHVYVHAHTDDQNLVQIILTEYWQLDLPNSPSTATDDRDQGASHVQDTVT